MVETFSVHEYKNIIKNNIYELLILDRKSTSGQRSHLEKKDWNFGIFGGFLAERRYQMILQDISR